MLLTNLFTINRHFLFDANSGGGEGGGTSTGEGGQPGSDTGTGDASGGSAGTGGTANNSGGNGATFTQADVDRVAGQTRKEALKRWARELGYEDPKAIEDLIKAQKDAQEAAKTELQKAQDAAASEKTRAEAAEARLYETLLRAAFDRAAMEKVADLELAYLAARDGKLLSGEAVTVDVETGQVSGLDKVVEKLLKDKPILKKTTQAAPGGTGGSEGGTKTPTKLTPEQEQQYRMRYGIRGS